MNWEVISAPSALAAAERLFDLSFIKSSLLYPVVARAWSSATGSMFKIADKHCCTKHQLEPSFELKSSRTRNEKVHAFNERHMISNTAADNEEKKLLDFSNKKLLDFLRWLEQKIKNAKKSKQTKLILDLMILNNSSIIANFNQSFASTIHNLNLDFH
jgi:hypothetical protein